MKHLFIINRALLICFAIACASTSHADMMISPVRVMMDDANKTATMILRNTSNGSRTYRLSWEDKRGKVDGSYEVVADTEQWPSAKDMIRLSPRQVTVGPGENQTIRFSWRPPANLPTGEYRSHLLMRVVPDVSEPSAIFGTEQAEEGIGIQINMQMSFSLPIVVRHSTAAPQVSLESVQALPAEEGETMGLQVTFNRAGEASSFGTVIVEMQRDSDSPVEVIGTHRDLSIFPEVDQRTITVTLRDANIPAGATVRVAYVGSDEYDGITWAERVFKTQ